jgi:RNA polymerase sigma factor (sigma-70 family)
MYLPRRQSPIVASASSLPPDVDEAVLIAAMLADDARAWRTFHDRYARVLIQAINRIKRRFPHLIATADVVDIHAEVCLQLLSADKRRLRCFDAARGTPLRVWLGVLAQHAAYDFLRECRRRPRLLRLSDELSDLAALCDEAPDSFSVCSARQSERMLAKLIAELPARDQEFVSLYYCQGLDPEQTAERLGICVGTVYSKKYKIRARIENLLEKCLAA